MGAWGTGVYDNDDAADWAWTLESDGLDAVRQAFAALNKEGYVDGYLVWNALAAADVVARLKSGGGETTSYAEGVIKWVDKNRETDWSELVPSAIAAVDRVLEPSQNEGYDLWAETNELDAWIGVVEAVKRRLT